MSKNRTGYRCRIADEVPVPCNWVKDGICGGDARKCEVKVRK